MSVATYPWLSSHWQQLTAYGEQQRIPQALLFAGPDGLGKTALATAFAGTLLCSQPQAGKACQRCHACQLVAAGNHPDLIMIQPEEVGKAIGIDTIRRLITRLSLKPHYEQQRVVIIQPADALNTAAANAFLKILEEPGERTQFILLTSYANRLLATVRSRCQKLLFLPPAPEQALVWLQQQGVKQSAEVLLRMAQGSPLKALAYAELGLEQQRTEIFQQWLTLPTQQAQVVDVAEQWQKNDAIGLETILSWMGTWLSDLVKLQQGLANEHLQNPDLQMRLAGLVSGPNTQALFRHYDHLNKCRQHLQTTLNKQLLLEKLLLEWVRIHQGLAPWSD